MHANQLKKDASQIAHYSMPFLL